MIVFFPEPYPDELVYSLLARYYVKAGYLAFQYAVEDLYIHKYTNPDVEFLNELKPEFLDVITDKYQEDHVSWWDCVDVISSSGYYPIDQWEQELDRIEKTVLKYRKPFFFAEARCMSRKGSGMIPNNRELQGELLLEEQCEWYRAMFEACKKRPWLRGFALWEWAPKLPSASEAWKDDSYEICEKPVQEIIKRFYEHEAGTPLM